MNGFTPAPEGQAAEPDNLEAAQLHLADFVGRLEPAEDHLQALVVHFCSRVEGQGSGPARRLATGK